MLLAKPDEKKQQLKPVSPLKTCLRLDLVVKMHGLFKVPEQASTT